MAAVQMLADLFHIRSTALSKATVQRQTHTHCCAHVHSTEHTHNIVRLHEHKRKPVNIRTLSKNSEGASLGSY